MIFEVGLCQLRRILPNPLSMPAVDSNCWSSKLYLSSSHSSKVNYSFSHQSIPSFFFRGRRRWWISYCFSSSSTFNISKQQFHILLATRKERAVFLNLADWAWKRWWISYYCFSSSTSFNISKQLINHFSYSILWYLKIPFQDYIFWYIFENPFLRSCDTYLISSFFRSCFSFFLAIHSLATFGNKLWLFQDNEEMLAAYPQWNSVTADENLHAQT